jgi:hypothetical protein
MMLVHTVVSAGGRVRPWRGRGKKDKADKERLTVSLGIAAGRLRPAANVLAVLAVLAVLLHVGSSLCGIDLRLVEHDSGLALELLSHGLDCEMRWL